MLRLALAVTLFWVANLQQTAGTLVCLFAGQVYFENANSDGELESMDESTSPQKISFAGAIFFELAFIVVALGLSLIGVYDHQQPLNALGWSKIQSGLIWGTLASLPLLTYLVVFHYGPKDWFNELRKFCFESLQPLFAGASLLMLAMLSIAAGMGEELLFRWSLQGGLTSLLEPSQGRTIAAIFGILAASLVFGLCHAITRMYFLLTFLGGIFLGWTMWYCQNWLVPAAAHSIYDFVALIYIVRILGNPTSDMGSSG